MTEQEVKMICKLAVQNSKRPFTDAEKELLKRAIDSSENLEELLAVALSTLMHE